MPISSRIEGLKIEVINRPLFFKKPAQTSRKTLSQKPTFLLKVTQNNRTVWGECSLIPGLSYESVEQTEEKLKELEKATSLEINDIPKEMPALRFAVETVVNKLSNSESKTPFSKGSQGQTINGLIWMGDANSMVEQARDLKARGFKTIKLKIGALDFDEELKILNEIREICPHPEYTLRLDANGAWGVEALDKLNQLSEFNIHSIEQPVAPGQFGLMKTICDNSPIDITLDEELIGVFEEDEMSSLLDATCPQYIILKPSLIGGLEMANKWIIQAEKRGIGWWSTSALESNVGLEVIANWTAQKASESKYCVGVSGLGTGNLFTNNTISNMKVYADEIWHKPKIKIGNLSWPLCSKGTEKFAEECPAWAKGIAEFLAFWINTDEPLKCNTSGSTGEPKEITHSREAAIYSAKQTLKYFGLKRGDTIVLALPMDFIAGKMMLLRALVSGLNIEALEPNLNIVQLPKADFCALTPHQAMKVEDSLCNVTHILLGGAPSLHHFNHTGIYEGFGMTETITQIALRKHGDKKYKALPGVEFSSNEGKLTINSPERGVQNLKTDDVVELHSPTSFTWIGRGSDIINSGGIKHNPEHLEAQIRHLTSADFAIYGVPHPELGQTIELRANMKRDEEFIDKVEAILKGKQRVRSFVFGQIERNSAGKILRKKMGQDLPTIVFATGNKNKVKEVATMLEGKYNVKSLSDIGCTENIPETSDTLEGNAALKARHVVEKYGYDCFADDTGLEVTALDGAPGVYTARYGGPEKDSAKNMSHLLSELSRVGSSDRSAQFRTAIHIIHGSTEKSIEGICTGTIATEQSGKEGFGYDPVFIPTGETRTFSEMSQDEKNKISHRGVAIREMLEYLSSLQQ